jgi:putative transposase
MAFWRLYYHLVWSTKNREPLIKEELEKRLFSYVVSKAAELDVFVYAINGYYDHLHLIVAIPPKHSVADVVKSLKGASSYYLNHECGLDDEFSWQRGYGALSLGERQRPQAEAYVRGQKEHHRDQTTNVWLERTDALDEGPADGVVRPDLERLGLREEGAIYDVLGEPPF